MKDARLTIRAVHLSLKKTCKTSFRFSALCPGLSQRTEKRIKELLHKHDRKRARRETKKCVKPFFEELNRPLSCISQREGARCSHVGEGDSSGVSERLSASQSWCARISMSVNRIGKILVMPRTSPGPLSSLIRALSSERGCSKA